MKPSRLLWAASLLCLLPGCDEFVLNQTASLGGSTVGNRGTVRVVFINNTPNKAVFTAGTFDQSDQRTRPNFFQYSLAGSRQLDAGATSVLETLTCGRVFAVGTSRLKALIRQNASDAPLDESSLVDGVEFFAEGTTGDSGNASLGFASPLEVLVGVDFPCGALLVVRFEQNETGVAPFRIDFQLIPASSSR